MYCLTCGADMEEAGGTQMKGCPHFLCTQCIVDVVNVAETHNIPCAGYKGVFRCTGYLENEKALEFMVPTEVYQNYLTRVKEATEEKNMNESFDGNGEGDDDGGAGAFANLDLVEEEKTCGWAHKAAWIDDLVRNEGYTFEEANDHLEMLPILENRTVISCPICLDDIEPGKGIVLKDCLHLFCKKCIGEHIRASETAEVICPVPDCEEPLKIGEVAALVSEDEVRRHFEQLSLKEAEASMQNVAHCLTPNCMGFVIAEQDVTVFECPVCRARNCVACKVIHDGTCKQYRQRVADDQNRATQRQNDVLSENAIQQNLNNRIFVRCPHCNVVIEKNGGCPNMQCSNRGCGREFVWNGVKA